jgi:hypothetical protein
VAVRQHLGREPLQPDFGKTYRGHRAAQKPRATGTMGSGANRPSAFNKARSLAAD